ncbi:class I SAM-dependent methyltransferase [Halalkalibacter urbisdiaboli]|uniref:class I SAM-dependent methyltransferase n=1 Tax=Halalkalibacter urbisdiaboli TaxID=1960589 RepID=UPI000B448C9A|nr:class I SAM-dependent methyltransferase [Halalkalibacter urbisdiaboli]
MSRIQFIRNEEKKYHDFCYENYKLFEKGSWLYKPVKTVMDFLASFEGRDNLKILDLGSGVGRNSIPIAQKVKERSGKVVCVDLLDSAIEKLEKYSREFGVDHVIETEKADIGNVRIKKAEFDYIVAVSSLEHVMTEKIFDNVIQQMVEGTKSGGINCIIVNSEVIELDMETGKELDALIEINLPTEYMLTKLNRIYEGWDVKNQLVKPLEFEIVRHDKPVLLKTNAITYVVEKK